MLQSLLRWLFLLCTRWVGLHCWDRWVNPQPVLRQYMSVLLSPIETGRQVDVPDPTCLQIPDCFERCWRVRDQVAPAQLTECLDRSGPDPALDPLARHLQAHRGLSDRYPAWPVVPAAAAGNLDPVVQADALHRPGQDLRRASGRAVTLGGQHADDLVIVQAVARQLQHARLHLGRARQGG